MAEFIHFEAEVSGSDNSENEIEDDLKMKSFINDESESANENEQNFAFVNAQIDINKANTQIE